MVVLLDGGFSSQLKRYIEEKTICDNPLWCSAFLVSHPDAVVNVHSDFIKAGCNVIITNTYQASIEGFNKYLSLNDEESSNLIKQAVQLAFQAIEKSKPCEVQVAGSVGPYGACLHDGSEYRGDYIKKVSKDALIAWHRPRVEALVSAGVDFLAIETIPALDEALALIDLLNNEFPDQKFWISFSCKNERCISNGELFKEVADKCCKVAGSNLVAIGVNCLAPSLVSPLLNSAQGLPVPFIVYPNGGGLWKPGEGWLYKGTSLPLTSYISEWESLGALYIGGCCGNAAEDIELCRKEIDCKTIK